FFGTSLSAHGDIEFCGGITAEIDYLVEGHVWVYDANVVLYEPAHIQGAVVTGSESVLDVYGGQIDYMLIISTSDLSLPEGVVTVYGTDFAVDGVGVDPNTTELFLQGQSLSGVYESGTPFAFPVDCVIVGGRDFLYYQTVRLGWVVDEPEPDIEVSERAYHLGKIDVGSMQAGVVPVFNRGDAALAIESLQLEQGEHVQYTLQSLKMLPAILEPNSVVDLAVSFRPVIEGVDTAVLSILSNDPNEPVIDVVLTGEGVSRVLSPEEQLTQILDAYDLAAGDGSIQGIGKAKSATNKVKVFGKILSVADELLLAGYDTSALETLLMIETKCDGEKAPEDFIQGPAAEELNRLINELIDTLQQ
ncbi:MAG: choice-of-anchor D domain-containing protein, partial [Anaerohalosphaeraceae bacterium]